MDLHKQHIVNSGEGRISFCKTKQIYSSLYFAKYICFDMKHHIFNLCFFMISSVLSMYMSMYTTISMSKCTVVHGENQDLIFGNVLQPLRSYCFTYTVPPVNTHCRNILKLQINSLHTKNISGLSVGTQIIISELTALKYFLCNNELPSMEGC
jgi:hypothetical protein